MPTRPRSRTPRLELQGALWLSVGGRDLGGHGRIGLLRAIVEQGTLTAAAQAIGLSYKAAWDAVQTMNELAGQPLVQRVTGGRGGGSSQLTPHGLRLGMTTDDIRHWILHGPVEAQGARQGRA